jgi:putative ABC transport system permease protein
MTMLRNTPLAWKNLTHDWRRLAVAVAGIGFAVLLMFTQVGF